jgi:hypothetical protein
VIDILEDKISRCDAVICLVGFVYGQEPKRRPADALRRSYTQLEYDIAKRLGKPVYLFLATDPFDTAVQEPDALRQLQRTYRETLRHTDQAHCSFASIEELRAHIGDMAFAPVSHRLSHRDVADWISIHRLPTTGPDVFGREHEIALLDNAWLDPNTNVVSIVAWGGVGKSALVNFWLESLAAKNYGGAQRVFAWSFYNQGTTDGAVPADLFIEVALDWFGDPESTSGDPQSKALRLASLIRKQRTLLLLDGLEPVQDPPGPNEGRLKDNGLKVLLRELVAFNPGLCVITSRLPLPDLASFERRTAPRIDLGHLTDEAGAALLRNGKVRGTQAELEEAAREFGGHALALLLVASFLRTAYEGDVRCWRHIQLLDEDQRDRGHARRVLAAYEAWFEAKPEGQVLRAVGLFDRPAERSVVAALRADPAIDGLTDVINGLPRADWNRLVTSLRALSLLAPRDPVMPEMLDAHPLVREYFGSSLRKHHPEAWRAGHLRLYEYYKSSARELPTSIDEMEPLYAAANHGCQASEYNEVLHDVIVRRILRGSEYFSTRKLGAFGSDLSAFFGFFTRPWIDLVSQLSDEDRSFILECVGVRLRGLNRLSEAVEPMEAAVRAQREQGLDKLAARGCSRISNLFIFLGEFESAKLDVHFTSPAPVYGLLGARASSPLLKQAGRLRSQGTGSEFTKQTSSR